MLKEPRECQRITEEGLEQDKQGRVEIIQVFLWYNKEVY